MEDKLARLKEQYDIVDYRNASGVLKTGSPDEFEELLDAFLAFKFHKNDLLKSGGNESPIPKKFSSLLRHKHWRETKISGDLNVYLEKKNVEESGKESETYTIEKFLEGHKIDYVKNRVAFDLEWNSKDQTFDRDLYAFATFYQANIIDAAVLVTRSADMNPIFDELGIRQKYGASTTWMGKLEYRLHASRSGGCPVLALGITPKLMEE